MRTIKLSVWQKWWVFLAGAWAALMLFAVATTFPTEERIARTEAFSKSLPPHIRARISTEQPNGEDNGAISFDTAGNANETSQIIKEYDELLSKATNDKILYEIKMVSFVIIVPSLLLYALLWMISRIANFIKSRFL